MALDHIDQFVADLRASPFHAQFADEVANSLASIDLEGDANPDAAKAYAAISWIIEQPRTLDEKLKALERLARFPRGKVEIASMRQFTGWHS
jgi:hypothetical protein